MKHKLTRLTSLLLALIMSFSMLLIPAQASNFEDVSDVIWYGDAVNYVQEKGWMNGVSATSFAPNAEVTRAMFVTVLARLAGEDGTTERRIFADVSTNTWYSRAIEWAYDNGVVNGVSENYFAPKRSITRQDLCTMLYRFVQTQELELPEVEDPISFKDEDSVSSYAKSAVEYCTSVGLVAGYTDGSFHPKDTATRAQAATILMRFGKALEGEVVKAEPMPAQSFEETVDTLTVNVEAPEGALPEASSMQLTKIENEKDLEILSSHLNGQVLAAVDISFLKNNSEREPEKNVAVQFTMEGLENVSNPVVVHITDTGAVEYVSNVQISNAADGIQALNFDAKDFSVYAVVDASDVVKVRFFKTEADAAAETNVLSEQLIGNNAGTVGQAIDPPVELTEFENFVEWKILDKDVHGDIAVINEYIASHYNESATKDLRVVAVLKNVRYLVYYDDNEVRRVLKTAAALYDEGDDCTTTVNFDFVPVAGDKEFRCWNTEEDGTGTNYNNGASITLTENYTYLYPVNDTGVWLSFDNNIDQDEDPTTGSFTSPVFYTDKTPTVRPANPTRTGYTFVDWYKDAAMTEPFNFGGTISEDTKIYAKWEAAEATYHVVIWQQKITDAYNASDADKTYDFYKTIDRTAATGSEVTIYTSNEGTEADNRLGWNGNGDNGELGFYFNYNENNTDTDSIKVKGDGSTVLNVYYDREIVYYYYYNTTSSDSNDWDNGLIAKENGRFYYYEDPDASMNYKIFTADDPIYYGREYYRSSGFQYRYLNNQNPTASYSNANSLTAVTFNSSNNIHTATDSRGYVYYWTGNNLGNYTYCYYLYYHDTGESGIYLVGTGPDPEAAGAYDVDPEKCTLLMGLYGSQLKPSDWPSAGSGYAWRGEDELTYPMALTEFVPPVDDEVLSFSFYRRQYSGSYLVQYLGQTVTGGDYTVEISRGYASGSSGWTSSTWTPNETIRGFKVVGYRYGTSGNWTSCNTNSSINLTGNGPLQVAFERLKANLVFNSNNTTVKTENVYYGASLSSYASYVPTNGPAGYYFDGWYADSAFGEEFNFDTTMPVENVQVYAKWTMMRFRVVLDPTGGDDSVQPSDVTFPGNQATTFRLDYGEEIQKSSIQAAERDGYTLTGWYYDKAHTRQFSFSFSDWESVADMSYADASDEERRGTDPWNGNLAYDDADGKHDDVVGKVVLYANWRKNMGDNSYLKVRYDAGDGSFSGGENIRLDPLNYADGAEAVAQPASAAPAGQEFVEWKIMKPTSSTDSTLVETGLSARPGDAFSVLMDNAVQEGEYYIVTLKATYYALTYTHITWVGNGGTMADGSTQKESESVPLNTLLPIEPGDLFVNPGRTFLGWARFAENECVKDDNGIWQPKENANANLWLEYHKAEGTTPAYFTEKTQGDRTVKYVAADETLPYQILYAVWSEANTYYVYHSSNGVLEAKTIYKDDGGNIIKVNLQNEVLPNYFYGGYFKNTAAVTADAIKKAQGAAPLASNYKATVEGFKAYDGSATLVSEGVRFWKRAEAYRNDDGHSDAAGTNVTPVAGTVYYLKEVPQTYLQNKMVYVYHALHGDEIKGMYLLTVVDDSAYQSVYFNIDGVANSYETLARSFTLAVDDWGEDPSLTYTAASFGTNLTNGYVAVKMLDNDTYLQEGKSFVVTPAWKTMDGVDVRFNTITYTVEDSKKISTKKADLLYVNFEGSVVNNCSYDWTEYAPVFRAYYYGTDTKWSEPMLPVGNGKIYKTEVPSGSFNYVKIVRLNPADGSANWDIKWTESHGYGIGNGNYIQKVVDQNAGYVDPNWGNYPS